MIKYPLDSQTQDQHNLFKQTSTFSNDIVKQPNQQRYISSLDQPQKSAINQKSKQSIKIYLSFFLILLITIIVVWFLLKKEIQFQCKIQNFTNWEIQHQPAFIEDEQIVQIMPYPGLYFLQNNNAQTPKYHYPEVLSYLSAYPVKKSVYIHSAPVYLSVIIIASLPKNVDVIISDSYEDKQLLRKNVQFNRICKRVIFSQGLSPEQSIDSMAELFFTTSVQFAYKSYQRSRLTILYLESNNKNPAFEIIQKLSIQSQCSQIKMIFDQRQQIDKGFYLIKEQCDVST